MKREMKIGLFLAVAFAILGTFIVIVGDISILFKKPGYHLYVSFDSAAGLEKSAAVRMAGVRVGEVRGIELIGRESQVQMSVSHELQVPKDSKATLASLGLLGEKYVEIIPGSDRIYCQPGDVIQGLPSVSLDQLGTLLLAVGDEVKDVGEMLRGFMSEESKARIAEILENLTTITEDLMEVVGTNKDALDRGIKGSSRAIQNLDQSVREVTENIDKTVFLLQDVVGENRENVRTNLEKIREWLSKLEETTRLLNETLKKINRGEGTLGKLVHEPELFHEAEMAVAEARKTFTTLSGLKAQIDFRTDYYGESDVFQNSLGMNLWLTPRHVFFGRVVHDPWLDKFTYSAQGGVRMGNIVPRAGLVESSFGAGLDYFALKDRLVLSLESFDFNRHQGPQMRFFTRYFPLRHLYFVLGIDDFAAGSKREVFFGLGLGLK